MVNLPTSTTARETAFEDFSTDSAKQEAREDIRNGKPEVLAIVQARGGFQRDSGKKYTQFG